MAPGSGSLIWTVLGFSIYGCYGYWHSRLHKAGRANDGRGRRPDQVRLVTSAGRPAS